MADAETLAWYGVHHAAYADRTLAVDMSPIRSRFVSSLGPGSRILDVGSGSGRDALAFRDAGYDTTGIDPVHEFVENLRGKSVRAFVATAEAFTTDEFFDGVWASASLLHLDVGGIRRSLVSLRAVLRSGGRLFVCFKDGGGTARAADGRLYTDLDEAGVSAFLQEAGFVDVETWRTASTLPGIETIWTNALATKP